jgi:hypothetical protein
VDISAPFFSNSSSRCGGVIASENWSSAGGNYCQFALILEIVTKLKSANDVRKRGRYF